MSGSSERLRPPVIDVGPLRSARDAKARDAVARSIERACRDHGFFYVRGHGVEDSLVGRLEGLTRAFFERPLEEKLRIRMELGGRAWRGYFRLGEELTSGRPDAKEGLYFGAELDPTTIPESRAARRYSRQEPLPRHRRVPRSGSLLYVVP